MKIDAFSLELSSSRTYSKTTTFQTTEEFSFGTAMDSMEQKLMDTDPDGVYDAALSPDGKRPYHLKPQRGRETQTPVDLFRAEVDKLRQIASLILETFRQRMELDGCFQITDVNQVFTEVPTGPQFRWEFTQTQTFTYEEQESLSVSAGGTVRTADNREIDFSMDLLMERRYFRESSIQYTETGFALIDPLVIQTDASSPMLRGGQFSFDLNQDGEAENLSLLGEGYAFLALDLNQDGRINDGSELFGPATGSGFGELSEYDQDNNLWIDENDDVFDRLLLWQPSGDSGGGSLTSLADAGLGAIYLGGISSQFSLTGEHNDLMGQVTETSIALTEDGDVLPVHEMEYKV